MPECIILVGPPGSGKTTLAKEYEQKGFCRISQDDQGKEHFERFKHDAFIGENIVIDRMGFNKQQRKKYIDVLKEADYKNWCNEYKIKIIVLHENKETCLARCLARENHPTIKDETNAQSALNLFFSKYERPTPDEADEIEFRYPDNIDFPKAVICDLDGTLCNIDHRLHFVQPVEGKKKDWKSFMKGIPDDKFNLWCGMILRGLRETYDTQIVYCSGRSENEKKTTVQWLQDNFVYKLCEDTKRFNLYMRPRDDHRTDFIVKENILDFELLTRFKILFTIDDRQQVVDMWRRRGITCLQCAPGDF